MRHLCALAVAFAVLVTVVSGAEADGSPYAPGLVQGASGALAPSGDTRYVTLATARSTVVAAIGVRRGLVLRSMSLRGFYGVPIIAWDGSTGGVSGDGRTLVLASYGPLPGDEGVTRFVLLRTRTLRKVQSFALEGSWAFDAISPDGSRLYLVEYLSSGHSPHYRVRSLTTSTGRLDPEPIVDRREAEVAMRGQPVTRRTSGDGRWAYTLYARGREPFVHALDTVKGEAYCIDLPLQLRQLEQMGLRLRLSAGSRLEVRRGRVTLAIVDTESLELRATGR
jgi:hypothetical protein